MSTDRGKITRTLHELGIPTSYGEDRGMPVFEDAADLVSAGLDVAGREQWLRPAAAAAWHHMRAAAESDAVTLLLVSAFRSFEQQREILNRKLEAGQALEHILAVNAPPGYSQHHSGNAVDLATPGCALLTEDFERTGAFLWLRNHAASHGFSLTYPRGNSYGIAYEPWHWAFGPTDVPSITLRDHTGRKVVAHFRRASVDDIPEIEQLITLSARGLSRDDYSQEQIEAALGGALAVDSQLIRDGTYFIAETDGKPVACGGWSWRKTLFGGDGQTDREPELLDPTRDAARIRAFFVHPDWARQGLGRKTLELCEVEARRSGFTSAELMATRPGERLYRSCGYISHGSIQHTLPGGVAIQFVPMRKNLSEPPADFVEPRT